MKRSFFLLALLFCVMNITQAGSPAKNKYGLSFLFGGFGTTTVNGINGGVGGLYYFDQSTALRGSIGGTLTTSDSSQNPQAYTVSAGIAHDVLTGTNTIGYLAVDGIYSHSQYPVVNTYGADIVAGGAFYAWPSVAFWAEYQLGFLHNAQTNVGVWSLGVASTQIGVTMFFD